MNRFVGILTFLFVVCAVVECKKQIPEKFLGSWDLKESENFENYLVARGFNWFMRQIITYSPVTKTFEKSVKIEGTYNAFILTPTKEARWYGWSLGTPFTGIYVDDDQHKIVFDYDEATDTLTEKHENLDKKDEPKDLLRYQVTKENRLVMMIEAQNVSSKRFYDKQ
ncbi:putative effector protein [Aphelenchoides bicaudatus]|nr:putative effector protein [Aphelenchoides bicaudatus]